jgi:hypothetical protein
VPLVSTSAAPEFLVTLDSVDARLRPPFNPFRQLAPLVCGGEAMRSTKAPDTGNNHQLEY